MDNRLRELRTERGLVQGALATKAGVSAGTIGAIERYGYPPSITVRKKIAKALRVRLEDIWPPREEAVA
jgi:putative transcriptional regulator